MNHQISEEAKKLENLDVEQRSTLKVLGFVIMCVGFFLFHIWLRTLVLTKGYEVNEIRKSLSKLESDSMALKVVKRRLMSSRNLEKLVRDFREDGVAFKTPEAHQLLYTQPTSP